jgi:hypothetical protein
VEFVARRLGLQRTPDKRLEIGSIFVVGFEMMMSFFVISVFGFEGSWTGLTSFWSVPMLMKRVSS